MNINLKMGFKNFILKFILILPQFSAQGPILDIQAVIKGTAYLPCDIRPPVSNDTAILVVWYRNEMDAIYSYDSRRKVSDEGSHWKNSSVVGNRAFFRTMMYPAVLSLDEVRLSDEGLYRCRVDFKKSPTRNSKINLLIIIPPDIPVILDQKGHVISKSIAGPYEEHTDVKLQCKVTEGKPKPIIRWWRGETLLDSTVIPTKDLSTVINELLIRKVSRSDLKMQYACQASNNNISLPQTTFVTFNIYLSPLEVSILSSRQPLTSDRPYNISCQTYGSRPPANITWWKDNEKLLNFTEQISGDSNSTISTLLFSPTIRDHNKTLICRAMNMKVKRGLVEDRWKLDITFSPAATLEYGLLDPNDIKEGDDIYFHCKVYANPRAYKVLWRHNGQLIHNDPRDGIITNYEELAIQSVKRNQTGNYSCFASNVEGDAESNILQLNVKYKPDCVSIKKYVFATTPNEKIQISCEVDANPPAETFRWSLNKTGEILPPEMHRLSGKKRNLSILEIIPKSEVDYGVVFCFASNQIGQQSDPCIFHVIPVGKPEMLQNCSIRNQTTDSLSVECTPGFEGGQTYFSLEVFDVESHLLKANLTSSLPYFSINDLSPGMALIMYLYAINIRGRSDPLVVEAFTLNTAEKHTGDRSALDLTPYVGVLLGFTIFFGISAVMVLGYLRVHSTSNNNVQEIVGDVKKEVAYTCKPTNLEVKEEVHKNPDVVRNSKVGDYNVVHTTKSRENVSKSHECDYKPERASTSNGTRRKQTNTISRRDDIYTKPCHIYLNKQQMYENSENEDEEEPKNRHNKNKFSNYVKKNENHTSTNRLLESPESGGTRISSPKEIVTVRTPLISTQQESCV